MTAFLTFERADGVSEKHFLDFGVFLKTNSFVVITELIKESFSVSEIFGDILLWLSLV
jgi:hypothetical protein